MSFCNATASPGQGKGLTRALCSSPGVTPAQQWEGEEGKVKQEGCEPRSRLMGSESSRIFPPATVAFVAPDGNPPWQGS